MMIYFLHMGFLVVGLHFGVQDADILTLIGLGASVLSAYAVLAGGALLQRMLPKLAALLRFSGLHGMGQGQRRP